MTQSTRVVTCFLEAGGKILVLRRSDQVGSYRGKWGGVAGFIETTPDQQALTEIQEETGLGTTDVILTGKGEPVIVEDRDLDREWVVYPFLFHVEHPGKIKIDWEHTAMKWITPGELAGMDTVPGLKEAYECVTPPVD